MSSRRWLEFSCMGSRLGSEIEISLLQINLPVEFVARATPPVPHQAAQVANTHQSTEVSEHPIV